MLCVHRPNFYQNSLAQDISLLSLQEDQHKSAKIRKIHPHTTDNDSYVYDNFMGLRSEAPQNFYLKEMVSNSFKRKIPIRRRPDSPVLGNFKNKLTEEGKEYSNLKDDNISQVMMHDDLNEAISQNNQFSQTSLSEN